MAATFTPEALQGIIYAAYPAVLNRKAQIKADRKAMPFWNFLSKNEGNAPVAGVTATGVNGPTIKYQLTSDLDIQGFERRDVLAFSEGPIELETAFPWSSVHMGQEFVHEDIETACGITIVPNQARSNRIGKVDSESQAQVLVDYWMAKLEAQDDKFDIALDFTLLADNSANPKLPQGLDAYLTIPATSGLVTTGTLGTKLRSSSAVLQHYAEVGLTYGSGGTLRAGLTRARRQGNLNLRGMEMGQGGIDFIMAGAGAIDRYVAFATTNNIQFTTTLADKNRLADIGLPDTGISFEGIPIIHNPTFENLDAALAPASPWTRRMYMLNSKTWQMSYAPSKKKVMSFPQDASDVRITRVSLDSKLVLIPKAINANAVITLAN
jgi:hypothetical protein